jgi:tartrate dehydrogenase/decarboxylase/D-malate dehydrogenase
MGTGTANPLAAIRSAGLMLDFLGETEAAQGIESAVADLLSAGRILTPDLGGTASTSDVGDAIAAAVSGGRS